MSLLGKKVMLVDDEQDVLSSLKSALEHWQASVDAFLKPKEAFEAFAIQPDAYNIIITDIKMSVMTGFELAAKVRALRPQMPILFISAYDIQRMNSESNVAGETPYEGAFRKPFDLSRCYCKKIRKGFCAKSCLIISHDKAVKHFGHRAFSPTLSA
jgi:two-component system cell cycle response regulator CpdR